MTLEEMVERFQCFGCVWGRDTHCGKYAWGGLLRCCLSHVSGVYVFPADYHLALHLPRGFNRSGFNDAGRSKNTLNVGLWLRGTHPPWDRLNIPVWALEQDGFLFVRTYAPLRDVGRVDVIEGGTLALVPQALDVKAFLDELD